MNLKMKEEINEITESIRIAMKNEIPEIDENFEGWCELGTMIMYRIVKDKMPNLTNKIVKGTYNKNGHFWNEINGYIVDTTIDQFEKCKAGIISGKYIINYESKEIINPSEEDLINFTSEVYDYIK